MKKTYTKKQIREAIRYWTGKLNAMNESDKVLKVICVYSAEFERDIPYSRGVASREGDEFAEEQTDAETEKAENFEFPVYLNVEVPREIGIEDFESVRDRVKEYALDAFNETNDFRFVRAVDIDFDDATDDMFAE